MAKKYYKALKIAIACCLSILICELCGISYSSSSGIVALLTITDSKKQTRQLALNRFLSFIVSIAVAIVVFHTTTIHWITFIFYIFFVVFIAYMLGWDSTISVNAVIGTHILFSDGLTVPFIMNEFFVVAIGVIVAIIINSIFPKNTYEELLHKDISFIEASLCKLIQKITIVIDNPDAEEHLFQSIKTLETYILKSLETAIENRDNRYEDDGHYYVDYMNMRVEQVGILENMAFKLKLLKNKSEHSDAVVRYLQEFISIIMNKQTPHDHFEAFKEIKNDFFNHEIRDYESTSILYGIVLDYEEFLNINVLFVDALSDEMKKIYWNE